MMIRRSAVVVPLMTIVLQGCNAPKAQEAMPMDPNLSASNPSIAAGEQSMASFAGSVTYRPRIALPPDAVVRVTLEDVSKADAPSTVIGETSVVTEGKQVPIPFTVAYSPAKLQPNGRYNVRATIRVGDQLAFTTTTATPFDPSKTPIEIVVQPASASVPPPGPATVNITPLEGTYWKLTEVAGQPAVAVDGFREAHLIFNAKDKRVSGMGGVNGIGGTYEFSGSSLRIDRGFSTLMAGPEPLMRQEQHLRDALQKTDSFRVTGRTLELLSGNDALARFEAGQR